MNNLIQTRQTIAMIRSLSDDLLEVFVRQRLGQQDAALRLSEREHLRFDFNAQEEKEKDHNNTVLRAFSDLGLDEYDIDSYKGSLTINGKDYSGDGTVSIIKDLIRNPILIEI